MDVNVQELVTNIIVEKLSVVPSAVTREAHIQNDLGADFFPCVAGDVNADGMLDVSDIVLLQKWILAIHGTKLRIPEVADLDGDGCLDVFDLGLMKQKLLENTGK
jgi:hypothetical protein